MKSTSSFTFIALFLGIALSQKSALASECQEGGRATVAVPFQNNDNSGMIRTIEAGTLVQFDSINRSGGRYIVDFAIIKGTGVRPILNPMGEITGCSVDVKRVASHHLCVGVLGECAATFAPKKLTFIECELNPRE